MNITLFVAKKLRLENNSSYKGKHSSLALNIAVIGISLAIAIMIISIAIVNGFKDEISKKIYELNPQIEISSYNSENVNNDKPISIAQFNDILIKNNIKDKAYIYSQKSVILKTENDFMGVIMNGYDNSYDSDFLKSHLIKGRMPNFGIDTINEIIISESISNRLKLKTGEYVYAFFVNDKVKTRKLCISGVFNTNFDEFDKNVIIGNQSLIRNVNKWDSRQGSTLAISKLNNDSINDYYKRLYSDINNSTIKGELEGNFYINSINNKYASFFEWLKLLDSNILIILILMSFVSIFTLISSLLIIVLERIDTIGILKSMGAANHTIRNIFILLSQKIIIKSIIWGNATALTICYIQYKFHIIKLDASSYFMSYVPVDINFLEIIIMNIVILIITLSSLIIPSYVITSIAPSKTIRYE